MLTDTEKYLLEKYNNWTLNTGQLTEVVHFKDEKCVLNAISAGRFPIKTYKIGKFRVADVREVAAYLDRQAESAA